MEESAHWHESSPSPEYGRRSNILNPQDVTLPERLRSLLLSRNNKHPPTTPCPTPDYRYISLNPLQAAVGNSLAPPRTHSFNATKVAASLQALESLNQTMGATRYDGPAGQVMERNIGQSRRQSIESAMPSDRISLMEDRQSSSVSGVDCKSQADLIGTRLSASDALNNVQSNGAKRPNQSTVPRMSYTLRTVPPKTHKNLEQRMQSDDQGPRKRPSETNAVPIMDVPNTAHTHHGPSSSALDALHHIQDHQIHSVPDTTAVSSHLVDKKAPASAPEPQSAAASDRLPSVSKRESSLSLHSVALDHDEDVQNPEISLLPKSSSNKADSMRKSSPVSRALSVLSNLSSASGLRSPYRQSIPQDDNILEDNFDEYQTGASNGVQDTDPSTLPSTSEESPSQYHLVQKQARTSSGISNLTSRPSQRKKIAIDEPHRNVVNTESTDEASMRYKQKQAQESFQRVIVDLESLLSEALQIADRRSREHSEVDEALPRPQGHGYRRLSPPTSDDRSMSSMDSDEDEIVQGHVSIMEPEEEDMYHAHFRKTRDKTPFPRSLAMTRQQSVAPSLNGENRKMEPEMSIRDADSASIKEGVSTSKPFTSIGWALVEGPTSTPMERPKVPPSLRVMDKEQQHHLLRDHSSASKASGNTNYSHRRLPIQPRGSSLILRPRPPPKKPWMSPSHAKPSEESISTSGPYVADFRNTAVSYHPVYRGIQAVAEKDREAAEARRIATTAEDDTAPGLSTRSNFQDGGQGHSHPTREDIKKGYSLKGLRHFEIREPHGFSLSRSHRRAPIARDWSPFRKRFVATVACINTTLLGLIIGIYAGEVPAIQYALADDHHVVILGNVVFFLGLATTTALFWPLPLLHGRRPYTTAALTALLLLLLPQALSVNGARNPYVSTYRVGLLVPRALAGLVMGFANVNLKSTLLDLFGASLQSGNPHQEVINEYDVRRHGGGMGVWLGIWGWCSLGSIGIGFWIGASIISGLQVSWGFYFLIILTAAALFLNVLTPETRRSAYRRSMAEVRDGTDVSRRIARGEVKMHVSSTGPLWWWEEVWAGHVLCIRMLKQPGFAILALYMAWIYAQVVLVIVLLGALLSKYYYFHPQYVGLSIAIMPLGAFLATPFQKASLFSRSRHHKQRTDSMTFEKRVTWTSHLVRRAIFMIILPFAGLAYTLASHGPPTHFMVPIIFAGLIGFLSNLAIAECNGIIMETFDTSDLQPGMTGRPRQVLPEEVQRKRTNFSSFPRVAAGLADVQAMSYCIAAAMTAWGGVAERHLGAQTATAVMAGVLLVLTLMLTGVLTRFKTVQVIPSRRFGTNVLSGPEDEWKPIIIGNPSGTTRRVSLLELGALSRWMEIRERNRLNTGFTQATG